MVDVEADADLFADGVVVVAGHQREHARAAGQLQGVEELGAAEGLRHDFGLGGGGVVVHHVVGPQQHVEAAALAAGGAAGAALDRHVAGEPAEFDLHVRRG